jgi:GNAT superfamily N-acetyltransferase
MGEVAIRPVRAGEAGLVLGFIQALAEYEKLSHEVVATEAGLAAELYAEQPRVFCDIAELDGRPVGFALWFYNYSTFVGRCGIWLEDLFVLPEARGAGAGKALLQELARRCVAEGLGRLEWSVLDWNAPAIGFYDSLGADAMDGWTTRRLHGEALWRLGSGS